MEENAINAGQAPQTENTEVQNTQETTGNKGKLFTQDEVNSFVKNQVGRMVSSAMKQKETEYNQRLDELKAREMRLAVKEALDSRGMPRELADIISCADEADMNSKLDALQAIYGTGKDKKVESPKGFTQVGVGNPGMQPGPDPIRKAMGLN